MKRRLCALLTLILASLILLTGCELPDSSSHLSTESQTHETITTEQTETSADSSSSSLAYEGAVSIKTTNFEASDTRIRELISEVSGYIESSSISGPDTANRMGTYTVRVPSEKFETFLQSLEQAGTLLQTDTQVINQASEFTDNEAKLTALETEEDALLELLGNAESLDDILDIQARITEVRHEIEYTERTLRNLQQQELYSTVQITLQLAAESEIQAARPFSDKLEDSAGQALAQITGFGEAILLFLIAYLPIVLIITAGCVFYIRYWRKHPDKHKDEEGE